MKESIGIDVGSEGSSPRKPDRYQELVAKYGKLNDLADVNYDTSFVVNVLVTGDIDTSPFLYALDCSQTVRVLYKEMARKLKAKRNALSLVHVEAEDEASRRDGYLCETVFDQKLGGRVTRYHVREGDTIRVIRIDRCDSDGEK